MDIAIIVLLVILGIYLLGALIWAVAVRRTLKAEKIPYSMLELLMTFIWPAVIVAYWINSLNND